MTYVSHVVIWAVEAIELNDFIPAHFAIWELELLGVDIQGILEEHGKGA